MDGSIGPERVDQVFLRGGLGLNPDGPAEPCRHRVSTLSGNTPPVALGLGPLPMGDLGPSCPTLGGPDDHR